MNRSRSFRGMLGLALVLAATTGAIHGYIGVDGLLNGNVEIAIPFIGMAVPYFVGVVLIAMGVMPRLWLRIGAGYVILLLVLWAAAGIHSPLAYVDKAIEVVLVVVLVTLLRRRAGLDRPGIATRRRSLGSW